MSTTVTPSKRYFVSGVKPLGDCQADTFGCSVNQFAELLRSPEANEVITTQCTRCGTELQCTRFISNFVGCDYCIEKFLTEEKMQSARKYWETVCPERFRSTLLEHPDFPKSIYLDAKKRFIDLGFKKSVFLIGQTGAAKTRVGFLLLKQALLANLNVGVLWPEDIPKLRTNFDSVTFDKYANYAILLVDDALMTACREPKQSDLLKQLIDVRMRHERATIFTSQVGSEAFKGGKEYGELSAADLERVDAIMRRLREDCFIVNFATPVTTKDEEHF